MLSIHFGLFTEESYTIPSIKICSLVFRWDRVIRNRSNAVVYFLSPFICLYCQHFLQTKKKVNKKSCLFYLSFYHCVCFMLQLLIDWEWKTRFCTRYHNVFLQNKWRLCARFDREEVSADPQLCWRVSSQFSHLCRSSSQRHLFPCNPRPLKTKR